MRRLKPFSYKQEMGGMERLLDMGDPHRVLLHFSAPFSLILLSLERNKGVRQEKE